MLPEVMPADSSGHKSRIDVGSVCQELSTADRGTSTSLHDGVAVSARPVRFNQVHLWEGKKIRPYMKELTQANIQLGLFQLVKCQVNDTVYTITGEQKTLASGTLKLKPHTYLVFDRSCRDVNLKDMVIYDGAIVCYGSRNVTFSNVKFVGCSLVVVAGATVTLDGVNFEQETGVHSGISLLISGDHSTVRADVSNISGGMHGIMVLGGARLEGKHLSIAKLLVAGIEVKGHGSTLELEDSSLSQFLPLEQHIEGSWSDGVVVRGPILLAHHAARLTRVQTNKVGIGFCAEYQGSMELNECISDGDLIGCLSRSFGRLSAQKVTITAAERYAFVVRRAGSASLVECTIQKGKNAGLYVDGSGSQVDVTSCKFLRNGKFGVFVCNDAHLSADNCESQGNKSAGYMVQGPAELELTDCTSTGDCRGCGASSGGKLTAENVIVTSSTREGFYIQSEADAELTRCTVSRVGEEGVYAANEGTSVHMHECAVVQPHNSCVFFVHGATGHLTDCKLSPWEPKAAVQCRYEGTNVEVQGCTVTPIKKFWVMRKFAQFRGEKCGCVSLGNESDSSSAKAFWAVDGAEIVVVNDDGSRGSLGEDGQVQAVDDGTSQAAVQPAGTRTLSRQNSSKSRSFKGGIDNSCIICMMRPKTMGFVHGDSLHFCACHGCAAKWFARKKSCPLCKKVADSVMWVYS